MRITLLLGLAASLAAHAAAQYTVTIVSTMSSINCGYSCEGCKPAPSTTSTITQYQSYTVATYIGPSTEYVNAVTTTTSTKLATPPKTVTLVISTTDAYTSTKTVYASVPAAVRTTTSTATLYSTSYRETLTTYVPTSSGFKPVNDTQHRKTVALSMDYTNYQKHCTNFLTLASLVTSIVGTGPGKTSTLYSVASATATTTKTSTFTSITSLSGTIKTHVVTSTQTLTFGSSISTVTATRTVHQTATTQVVSYDACSSANLITNATNTAGKSLGAIFDWANTATQQYFGVADSPYELCKQCVLWDECAVSVSTVGVIDDYNAQFYLGSHPTDPQTANPQGFYYCSPTKNQESNCKYFQQLWLSNGNRGYWFNAGNANQDN